MLLPWVNCSAGRPPQERACVVDKQQIFKLSTPIGLRSTVCLRSASGYGDAKGLPFCGVLHRKRWTAEPAPHLGNNVLGPVCWPSVVNGTAGPLSR